MAISCEKCNAACCSDNFVPLSQKEKVLLESYGTNLELLPVVEVILLKGEMKKVYDIDDEEFYIPVSDERELYHLRGVCGCLLPPDKSGMRKCGVYKKGKPRTCDDYIEGKPDCMLAIFQRCGSKSDP